MLTLNNYNNCFWREDDKNKKDLGDCKLQKNKEVNNPPKPKILKIIVKGLFNKFDYEFDLDPDENVQIIIAPNGAGKTTIMNFINFLFCQTIDNFNKIKSVPIQKFECHLTNGVIVTYERLSDDYVKSNMKIEVEEAYNTRDNTINRLFREVVEDKAMENVIELLMKEGFVTNLSRVLSVQNFYYSYSVRHPQTHVDNTINFLEEFNEFYYNNLNTYASKNELINKAEENIFNTLQMIKFDEETMKHKSSKFVDFITTNRINANFEKDINLQDFLNLFLENNIDEYKTLTNEEKINKTRKLIERVSQISFLLEAKSNLIAAYENCKTQQMKDWLNKKITIFKNIFDARNQTTNKEIEFFELEGFVIKQDGKQIPMTSLSSGEINDFALMYRSIFNTYYSSIILIDEPEISLHINWQETMIDRLIEAAEFNNTQIIVATHSPYIIHTHHDLIVKRTVKVNGK